MSQFSLRIGVDGGGTTTRAIALDENGSVVGRGEAPSSNHYSVGMGRAARHIMSAIDDALEGAGAPLEAVASWGLGLAGACTHAEQALWHEALAPILGAVPFVVDEDAAAAWAGAFAGGLAATSTPGLTDMAGAICIAGTGANCFGVNERGERVRADGLGPLLGDRGSGYAVGEAALRAVCRAHDGSGPPTSLLSAVLKTWHLASVDELVQHVYRPDWAKSEAAALFPLVLEAAEGGDAVAKNLLYQAGHDLAATTRAVLQSLGVDRLAPCGGILVRETPVRTTWEADLRRTFPDLRIQEPRFEPVIGAALLPSLQRTD